MRRKTFLVDNLFGFPVNGKKDNLIVILLCKFLVDESEHQGNKWVKQIHHSLLPWKKMSKIFVDTKRR